MSRTIALDDRVVPMRSGRQTVRLFEAAGVPMETLLEGTWIDADSLEDERQRISCRQAISLIRNGLADCQDPAIGLSAGAAFSISSYGLLGYAMMSCTDFAHALRIARSYYRTAGVLFDLDYRSDANVFAVQVRDCFAIAEVWPFVVEQLFSGFPPLMQMLLGRPVPPKRVRLSYPEPAWGAAYSATFGCPIEWNTDVCEYQFDNRVLTEPLARADAGIAKLFEASCRELLEELETEENLAGTITRSLLSHAGAPPAADAMARRLNMGTRTLRRRLAELGTSYQKILDEVRRRLALDYLRSTRLSTQEVAELLGFTEATNFRRAFIKWTGESPRAYRQRVAPGFESEALETP